MVKVMNLEECEYVHIRERFGGRETGVESDVDRYGVLVVVISGGEVREYTSGENRCGGTGHVQQDRRL